MAEYSVTSSMYLRNFYSNDRSFSKKTVRTDASERDVTKADSLAMRKAIRALEDYDYGDKNTEDKSSEKTEFYKQLKAFADTYNYTLDTSSSSSSDEIKSLSKKMKKFADKYADELDKVGISFDKKGYMEISASAVDNIKRSTYGELFSSGSSTKTEFLKDLDSVSSKIYRRIDTIL